MLLKLGRFNTGLFYKRISISKTLTCAKKTDGSDQLWNDLIKSYEGKNSDVKKSTNPKVKSRTDVKTYSSKKDDKDDMTDWFKQKREADTSNVNNQEQPDWYTKLTTNNGILFNQFFIVYFYKLK